MGKPSFETFPMGTRSKIFLTSTTAVATQQCQRYRVDQSLSACKNHSINLLDPSNHLWEFIPHFIFHIFLEILQRYCKLVILGTLAMPGYAQPKWYCQLVENFCVYLQAKNQLHPPCFSGDAKTWKLIFGTLRMSNYTHPKL